MWVRKSEWQESLLLVDDIDDGRAEAEAGGEN